MAGIVQRLARRAAEQPPRESGVWSGGDPVPRLLSMMVGRRRRRAAKARAAVEALWDESPALREQIWRGIWCRAEEPLLPPATIDFLLDGDPQPRLLTGLSIANPRLPRRDSDAAAEIVATGAFRELLRSTDHPVLLEELLRRFTRSAWTYDLALANPHAARAAAKGPPERAVLLVLAGRDDLLHDMDTRRALATLLHPWPPEIRAACDRALATLPAGKLREKLCRRATEPDAEPRVLVAVIAAGYLPRNPAEVPFFYLATRQWKRFAQLDPAKRQLYHSDGRHIVDVLLGLDNSGPPPDARAAADEALRGAEGQAREYLCSLALAGDPAATRVVVAAGHVPQAERLVPVLLFLTGQWDRYDAADPDGSRLRRYAARLPTWDPERDRLRAAARTDNRPAPCAAAEPRVEPARYRPGGTGLSGTGGFSVHGV